MMIRLNVWLLATMALIVKVSTFQGSAACDDNMKVYADGSVVGKNTGWDMVSQITLADEPSVVAIKCVNTGGLGGILASFDNGVVTDGNWRCSATATSGWASPSFNDSQWPFATEVADNPGYPWITGYEAVSSSAKWIWDGQNSDRVYCRRTSEPVFTFRGDVACDDNVELYADGAFIASNNGWAEVSRVTLSDETSVLAIKCVNIAGKGGILASFDNGVVTDSSWRCSAAAPAGWASTSFDDSQWAFATEIVANGGYPWDDNFEALPSSAMWIWDGQKSGTVYCRRTLTPAPQLAPQLAPIPLEEENTTFTEDAEDGVEVTPEGCKYRGVVHPAGEVWIQEVNPDPLRQKECTCPDPLPTNVTALDIVCTAVCVRDDGVVHYSGEQYQRTIDGVMVDCVCNNHGRERC